MSITVGDYERNNLEVNKKIITLARCPCIGASYQEAEHSLRLFRQFLNKIPAKNWGLSTAKMPIFECRKREKPPLLYV